MPFKRYVRVNEKNAAGINWDGNRLRIERIEGRGGEGGERGRKGRSTSSESGEDQQRQNETEGDRER